MKLHSERMSLALCLCLAAAIPSVAAAQVIKEPADPLDALAFIRREPHRPQAVLEPVEDAQSFLDPTVRDGWAGFRLGASGEWKAPRRPAQRPHRVRRGRRRSPGSPAAATASRARHRRQSQGQEEARPRRLSRASRRGFLPRVAHLLGVDAQVPRAEPGPLGPARRPRLVRRLRRDDRRPRHRGRARRLPRQQRQPDPVRQREPPLAPGAPRPKAKLTPRAGPGGARPATSAASRR